MATERKTVSFNVDDPLEQACWEYAKSINFSKWAKDRLKQIVLQKQAQRSAPNGIAITIGGDHSGPQA